MERVNILGSRIHCVDLESSIEILETLIAEGGRHQVAEVAVNPLLAARADPQLQAIYNGAALTLPDGVPLLWASRILRKPIPGRVTGLDLLPGFSKVAANKGYTFYFLGSSQGVPERLAEVLTRENSGLKVVGTYSPPYHEEFPRYINEDIIRRVNSVKPDVLWVGLSAPKQDRWIYHNLSRLEVRVAIGIGAAFDICSGNVRRAPVWMQRSGLEWFFRFLMEPRRLFKRYFIDAVPFFPLVLAQKVGRYRNKDRS